MNKLEFTLDWNDIHKALTSAYQEKTNVALESNDNSIIQSFISFTDKEGKEVVVENALILFKKIN